MSCCDECLVKTFYGCEPEITIGKVAPTAEVKVYFRHAATGRVDVYDFTPELDGTVIMTNPDLSFSTLYKVWIAIDVEPLPIDGTETTCISVIFIKTTQHEAV